MRGDQEQRFRHPHLSPTPRSRIGAAAFVLVSTDKAVNPTSVMGATKRLAELYVQALERSRHCTGVSARHASSPSGSATSWDHPGASCRSSSGRSKRAGPVTVTHPDMKRYFMTIPEASQLVMQAGAIGKGGEVFVLDMGQPVRILDLARELITTERPGARAGHPDPILRGSAGREAATRSWPGTTSRRGRRLIPRSASGNFRPVEPVQVQGLRDLVDAVEGRAMTALSRVPRAMRAGISKGRAALNVAARRRRRLSRFTPDTVEQCVRVGTVEADVKTRSRRGAATAIIAHDPEGNSGYKMMTARPNRLPLSHKPKVFSVNSPI